MYQLCQLKGTPRMLREPWESEKVILTGNLASPVGQSGCSVFLGSCPNSGILQFGESSVERQLCIPSGVEKVTG